MRPKFVLRRPIISLTQLILFLVVIFALFIALDLNRRARAGRVVGGDAETLQAELDNEELIQIQLQATKAFVLSDDYTSDYAHNEARMVWGGERQIVILGGVATPVPETPPEPTPDPAANAKPWQVWWQMLTDAPMPNGAE